MDTREKTTEFGDTFVVPTWIERIGNDKNHGWQLRLGKWTYFADGASDGSGSAKSLARAISELKARIKSSDIPSKLKKNPQKGKTNDLPVGISGPTASPIRNTETFQHNLQVTIPRYGMSPTTRKVYVGTDNTYTEERFEKALAKAIKIREEAVKKYERDHVAATRKAVASL